MKIFIPFLFFVIVIIGCTKETTPITPVEDHESPVGFELKYGYNKVLTYFIGVASDSLFIDLNAKSIICQINYLDSNKNYIDLKNETDKKFGCVIEDSTIFKVAKSDSSEWKFNLIGLKKGSTRIKFQLLHIDHPDFQSDFINVVVR